MKFKVDENLPVEIAQLIREAGHDVYTVHDQGLAGVSDQTLARVCQEEGRTLVTLDIHFADIRSYPPGDYPGLIVLRLARQDKLHVLEVMSRALKLFVPEDIHARLWIIDEYKIRIRE